MMSGHDQERQKGSARTLVGIHMALPSVASELRRGGQVYRGAGAAVSYVSGEADALGRILPLAARAAADRTHPGVHTVAVGSVDARMRCCWTWC
jgi:hypothetical protein